MVDLFFMAIAFAVIVAFWGMGRSIGEHHRTRKQPPNFKAGAVDPTSTRRGER